MKRLISSILIGTAFLLPLISFAQFPDDTFNFSWGTDKYPDVITIRDADNGSGVVLVSTTTPLTVVAFSIYSTNASGSLYCGYSGETPLPIVPMEWVDFVDGSAYVSELNQIHCDQELGFYNEAGGTYHLALQYVPYDTRLRDNIVNVDFPFTYQDFLFPIGVIVFLLSFLAIGYIFSPLKRKYR